MLTPMNAPRTQDTVTLEVRCRAIPVPKAAAAKPKSKPKAAPKAKASVQADNVPAAARGKRRGK